MFNVKFQFQKRKLKKKKSINNSFCRTCRFAYHFLNLNACAKTSLIELVLNEVLTADMQIRTM